MLDHEDLSQERQVYALGLDFADVAQALARLQAQGIGLGNRERASSRSLIAALAVLSDPPVGDRVAAAFAGMVQPTFGRPLLAEHLTRARDLLLTLVRGEPGLETVVLHPAQVAWLHEFLSDCCMLLLRGVATRKLGPT